MAYLIDIIVLMAHIYYLYIYKMIDSQDYNVYFYIFYVVFMTSLLLLNFYHFYKKENYYSIIEIIIYSIFVKFNYFFTFMTHFSQVIDEPFYLKYMIIVSYVIILCYIVYNIYMFFKYCLYQRKYIKQLEIDLKNNEVHLLRHNMSELLHQINNDIQIQNYQKAQDSIQTFIEKQYQSPSTIISTIPSLNDIFQLELMKYQQENISLSYFIDMIDNKVWDEKYNIMIYDILEKLRLNHNQMSLSLQQKPYGIICQVTSKFPVCKDLMYKDKRKFQHKQLDNGTHIYHLIMPLSSSTQLFSR